MNLPIRLAIAAALLTPLGVAAARDFTSLHPEEAIPDSTEQISAGPYNDFIMRVQEKLHANGFNAGPVNGDFGAKTQAALAQFQLSRTLPASGQLDAETLLELGVARDASASEGASAEQRDEPRASPENPPS
jgi:peptidoglycan hydrolase-like protein with peptidoglycan-binding domain